MPRNALDAYQQRGTDNIPVSVTFSGTKGFRYLSCRPDEYLIKTGLGVRNEVSVAKKTFQWPFQRVTKITLAPRNFTFTLHCISKDLVPFELPVVFTIGPFDPTQDLERFLVYASKMSAMSNAELQDVVLGCIHGQTRLYAAGLTVLEMFGDRDSFKEHVQERIGKELLSFGLQVFNGNIAEMRDSEGNAYFSSLKQKAISGATNDARVQVAQAKKLGDIGECENQAETKVRLAEVEAEVMQASNERQCQIARADLDMNTVKIQCTKDEEMRRVDAQMAPRRREAELQTELNKLDGIKRQEYLRATELAQKNVAAECTIRDAQAKGEAEKLLAEAQAAAQAEAQKVLLQAEAEAKAKAQRIQAEVDNFTKKQNAEAEAEAARLLAEAQKYAAEQAAEGMRAKMDAQAEGMQKLMAVAPPELIKFYLAVETGLFVDMADKTAHAVNGLQPKINVWNTGSDQGGAAADPMAPIKGLFTGLPPMLDALSTQTDVKLPNWLPRQDASPSTSEGAQGAHQLPA